MLFYAVFIWRSAFVWNGKVFFSLFDDAMISLHYARNLASGAGLVWNAGDLVHGPVEGYTNFLWTLWLAFLHLLVPSEQYISLAAMVSGALILLGNLALTHSVGRKLFGDSLAALAATILTASSYALAFWTLRGFEVGLLALLLNAAVLALLAFEEQGRTRDALLTGLWLGLAFLTRPDALVPAAVVFFFLLRARPERRGAAFAGLAALLALAAGHTAFRIWYYGDPLPNTYYLKMTGIPLGLRLFTGFERLRDSLLWHLWPGALVLLYALFARLKPFALQTRSLPLFLFLGQCAYSLWAGGDAWEGPGFSETVDPWACLSFANRYLAIAWPQFALFVAGALGAAAQRLDREALGKALRALLAVYAASLLWMALGALRYQLVWELAVAGGLFLALAFAPRLKSLDLTPGKTLFLGALLTATLCNGRPLLFWSLDNAQGVRNDAFMSQIGLYLKTVVKPGGRVAVVWAGAIPYFIQRYSVDLLGKSDPVIARLPMNANAPRYYPGHVKWDLRRSIDAYKPDLIAQFWVTPPEDADYMRAAGYKEVGPCALRRGSEFVEEKDFASLPYKTLLR
jgi:hypothetical protein